MMIVYAKSRDACSRNSRRVCAPLASFSLYLW